MCHSDGTASRPTQRSGSGPVLALPLTGVLWTALVLMGLPAMRVQGQEKICVPQAVGVPADPGPPNWWVKDVIPKYWTRLDDPRWRGAYSRTFGTGTAEEVEFRALYDGNPPTSLFLSWNGIVTPSLSPGTGNQLYVGFSPRGANQDVILNIKLTSASPNPVPPNPLPPNWPPPDADLVATNYATTVLTRAPMAPMGTAWTPVPTIPPWLPATLRVWVSTTPQSWAVQMKIPISNAGLNTGLNLPAPGKFNMWYEFRVATPTTPYIPYTWPPTVGPITVDGMGNDVYPDPSTWGETRMPPGADPNCPTNGVSLTVAEIGTTNTPNSQINLVSPNTFFAHPLNNTGNPIAAGNLKATFRIANWGSQPDWNQVPNPTQLWDLIPGGQDVPSASNTNSGSEADIHFSWQLTAAEQVPFQNGTKRLHQCMLVQLSGANLTFLNNSVVRNMDFVNASRFEREAEISVRKLPPIAGGGPKRDVYLYVVTRNMPAVGQVPPPVPGTAKDTSPGTGRGTGRDTRPDTRRDTGPIILRDLPRNLTGMRPGTALSTSRGQPPGEQPPGNLLPPPDPLASMPTYFVYVYSDTGKSLTVNGQKHPILQPQTSFGYFVQHDGNLDGWKHELRGAEQIAPNFYKIGVPNDGVATIITIIEAVEPGGGGGKIGGFPWWVWLLLTVVLLIVILLIVWAVSRRRPATP